MIPISSKSSKSTRRPRSPSSWNTISVIGETNTIVFQLDNLGRLKNKFQHLKKRNLFDVLMQNRKERNLSDQLQIQKKRTTTPFILPLIAGKMQQTLTNKVEEDSLINYNFIDFEQFDFFYLSNHQKECGNNEESGETPQIKNQVLNISDTTDAESISFENRSVQIVENETTFTGFGDNNEFNLNMYQDIFSFDIDSAELPAENEFY